ncbi:hypothetical protein ACFJZ3_002546 [Vibrio vulnificus]|nr:hypothetical protein [Vibrio vulnificus]
MKNSSLTFLTLMLAFFLTSISATLYMAVEYDDISLFFTFILFLLAIFMLDLGFKIEKKAYIAYFVFVTVMPFYLYSFFLVSGEIYIPGGDAEKYYFRVLDIASGDDSQLWGRYALFLYISKLFYQLTNWLFNSESYIHFSFLSSFFATLTIDPIHKIINNVFDKKIADKVVWFWICTPLLWYLSSGSLRDIYAYFSVLYCIYFTSCFFSNGKFKYLALSLVFLIYTANIRLDAALFSAIFISSYALLTHGKMQFKLIFSVLLVLFVYLVVSKGLVEAFKFSNSFDLSYQVDAYKDLRAESSSGSFTSKLQGTALGLLILPFFTFITPFPPPIFFASSFNTADLLISIFSLLFLLILPRFFISSWSNIKNIFILSFLISLFFIIIVLSLTSVGSFRQKLYMYPIIYALCLSCGFNYFIHKFEVLFISVLSTVAVIFVFVRYVY